MARSSVWRPFWHRFHSKIVPEGMKMTSEEPRRQQRASQERLGSVSGGSGELQDGILEGTWQKVLRRSYVYRNRRRDVRGCWKSSTSTSDRHLTACKNLALGLTRPAPGGGGFKVLRTSRRALGSSIPRFLVGRLLCSLVWTPIFGP